MLSVCLLSVTETFDPILMTLRCVELTLVLSVCLSICLLSVTETFDPILMTLRCVEMILMLSVCLSVCLRNFRSNSDDVGFCGNDTHAVCLSVSETFGPLLMMLGFVEMILMLSVCFLFSRRCQAHGLGAQVRFFYRLLRVQQRGLSVCI